MIVERIKLLQSSSLIFSSGRLMMTIITLITKVLFHCQVLSLALL